MHSDTETPEQALSDRVPAFTLQLMVNVLLGTETSSTIKQRADLNGDGAINAFDLQIVVNKMLEV